MIDGVKFVWLALAGDATACCCEETNALGSSTVLMPFDVFEAVAARIVQNRLQCRIILGSSPLPPKYADLCKQVATEIIVPNGYCGDLPPVPLTVVCQDDRDIQLTQAATPRRAILRVQRQALGHLASDIQRLVQQVPDISLRHAQLLQYTDEDFHLYADQLETLGQWLIGRGARWNAFRIGGLTDGLSERTDDCGAGVTHISIGPDGRAYLCPAWLHSAQDCGHVLEGITIPDRHLLTQNYSLLCQSCSVDSCLRCTCLNKKRTREYSVPASCVCKLAHIEQDARHMFAQRALSSGHWNEKPTLPSVAEVDPFQKLEELKDSPPPLWKQFGPLLGRHDTLHPISLLEVVLEIHGFVRAVSRCVKDGVTLPEDLIDNNTPLLRSREQTVQAYRHINMGPDAPSIYQIQKAVLHRVATRAKNVPHTQA